jgi:recombination protein RecA
VKDIQELIDTFVSKDDSVFIPPGRVEWRLPTGILTLDKILGGGFPGGSIVQLYGPESSGKTTLAYRTAAQSIKLGYSTVIVPIEKYSEQYAEVCGVDVHNKNFHMFSADYAEKIFNMCIEGIRNFDAQVIIMDSISAAIPKADLEKKQKTEDMDKGFNIGSQARCVSDFIRKIQQPIRRKQAIFLTVNQLSYQIGRWGGVKKPKGSEALQYFSDVKLNMWGRINKATQLIEVNITVDKGKDWDVIPFGSVSLNLAHAKGFDIESDVIMACEKANIVTKRGAWYNYGDQKFQGLEKFADTLRDNVDLKNELFEQAIKAEYVLNDGKEETSEENQEGSDES